MDYLTHVVRFTCQLDGSILAIDQTIVLLVPFRKIVTRSRRQVLFNQSNYIVNLEQDRKHPHGGFSDTVEFASLRNRSPTYVILAIADFVVPDELRLVAQDC